MQSQQKKVKWSRGETADALEERTDTGITQVSVSKLENIVADIYGNISRRPALKIVSQANAHPITPVGAFAQMLMSTNPATFVFTVNENKYIILVVGQYVITGYLIENEKFVRTVKFTDKDNQALDMSGIYFPYGKAASFAQSNNWAVLSGVWLQDKIIRLTDTNDITVEEFKFSAPWYAPGGSQSKTVSATDLPGLEFNKDGLGFTNFAWTDASGNSSPYSIIDTGLTGDTQAIAEAIPAGSIVKFPNLGCYMRVEGYRVGGSTIYFPDYVFDDTASGDGPFPSTGLICVADHINTNYFALRIMSDGQWIHYPGEDEHGWIVVKKNRTVWVQCTASATGYRQYNYGSNSWSDVPAQTLNVQMFGPLLTPVANASGKDQSVTVEYGYISLEDYQPYEFAFSQQRLYATRWMNAEHEIPGYAVGSQIAKFNDFKNDYNTQNEAVVIDINTTYQEKVQYVVDYNGVKIFTSDSEYAYSQQAGVAKQSTNGCSPNCRPIVFGAALLYTDKSKRQIRALQYELQTDIYQSNVINQMCQPDLVFNPVGMSIKYDKEYNTGSQLYVVQQPTETTPEAPYLISCNFVPANQAQIWGRWKIPELPTSLRGKFSTIVNTITVNNKPWFIVMGMTTHDSVGTYNIGYSLAELSYDNLLDFEIEADPTDTKYTLTRNDGFPFSLIGWVDDGGSDAIIYTNYEKFDLRTTAIGDPVYNKNGVQIGTISTIEYLTPQLPIPHRITVTGDAKTYYQNNAEYLFRNDLTLPGATVSVFDGDEYKWDDTLDANGNYTKPLTDLAHPRVGFMINAELISHPIDIQGKTYTEKKRIGKAVAVIRNTESGAFTVCDKTGYTSPDKRTVNFYGCTGMKDQVRYTIKNIKGAKFTIESLTMIIEYGTLDS
jgi:hypothetical protein